MLEALHVLFQRNCHRVFLGAMIAQRLKWAQLTFAGSVSVDAEAVTITRVTEAGVDTMKAQFPVVVSVVEKINEPRYPSFKGIMAAKKKPVEIKDLSSLGIDASQIGSAGAWSVVVDATPRPPKAAGIKIVDDGNGGKALVDFLVEKKFI